MHPRSGTDLHGQAIVQVAALILAGAAVIGAVLPVPVPAVIGARALIALPVIAVSALLRDNPVRPRRDRTTGIIALSGVLLAIHWMAFFQSVRVSSVAVGGMATFTFPVMTALVEPVVFRERFQRHTFVHAVLVFVGIIVVSGVFTGSSGLVAGTLWGLLSAAFYTARNLISRNHATGAGLEQVMGIQLAVVGLVLLAPVMSADWSVMNRGHWAALIALGVVQTAIGHSLFIHGVNRIGAATASVAASMQPIYGALLAFILIGQRPSISTIIGAAFILGAVVQEARARNRERRAQP